jgi:hypothetical protein
MTEKKFYTFFGILGILLVAVLLLQVLALDPPMAQGSTTNLTDLDLSGTLTVDGASMLTGNTALAGTLGVTGNTTLSADLVVDDTFNIDDTTIVISGTQTYTPTATAYLLNPSGTLTLTLATGSAAVGDFLWLVNVSAQSVIVVDTGATAGGGSRTLGQNDVIGFIYANSKWLEAFFSDNS